MTEPIINPATLTEEQREIIKAQYETATEFDNRMAKFYYQHGMLKTLEWLFGLNFFKKGE